MANEYDPENFDWGDDTPGIDPDVVGPDIIDQLLMAALDANEERYGWRYLKRSERKEGAGRLYKYSYYMPEEGRKHFEENYPGYTFVWDGALGHHDHPIAHLSTELGEMEMVDSLVRDNVQYVDLFGNGHRDAKYKRNCINMFALKTPKDYIRYQTRGHRDVPFDMDKLVGPEAVFGKIDHITCTHGMYYLSMEQIGALVNHSQRRRFHALVHRHSQTHGVLNAGEQEYWIDYNGMVTQKNVTTGEYYTHPTLEPLFHQFSARTKAGGVTWTVKSAGGDQFLFEFVGCPNSICTEFENVQVLRSKSWEEFSYSNISVCKFLSWTWMSAATTEGRVSIEDLDLFSKLRRYVAGKARTPRLKTETMNLARRLCNKMDIISIHGGGAHDIPVASMNDYVEVAFYVDQKTELDTALSFHRENHRTMTVLNKYYETGVMPRDFTALTGAAVVSARTISEAASGVLENLKQSQQLRFSECGGLPALEEFAERADVEPGGEVPGCWWG
jgi:hypothetical protein